MRPQEGALQITSVVLAGLVFVLMGVVLPSFDLPFVCLHRQSLMWNVHSDV